MARDYKKEYKEFAGTEKQKKNRAARNKARRQMIKEGKAAKGDGKDVAHKTALHNGGSNEKKNWKVESRKKNRSEGASIREGKKKK